MKKQRDNVINAIKKGLSDLPLMNRLIHYSVFSDSSLFLTALSSSLG